MPIINCYLNDEDYRRLAKISEELKRDKEELAEAAIAEAINDYLRKQIRG